MKPTNRIEINGNEIKVNDINTPIKITVLDVDGNRINLRNKINYFRLTKDDEHYVEVTDITFNNDDIIFKLPPMKKGLYTLEIKDNNGSIYPAGEDVKLLLRQSFEGLKETTYKSMSDHILEEIEPIILYHIEHNPEIFKGAKGEQGLKGDKGEQGERGLKGDKGEQGERGLKGDKGDTGVVDFDEITPEQIEMLKGEQGDKGEQGERGLKGDKGDKGDKGEIGNVKTNIVPFNSSKWENGSLFAGSGQPSNATQHLRTKDYIDVVKGKTYTLSDESLYVSSVSAIWIHEYENGVYTNDYFFINRGGQITFTTNGNQIKIVLRAMENFTVQPYFIELTDERIKFKIELGEQTPNLSALNDITRSIDKINTSLTPILNKAWGTGRFYTTNALTSDEINLPIYNYTGGGIHTPGGVLTSNGGPIMFSYNGHFSGWEDGFITIRLKVNDTTILRVQASTNPVQLNYPLITEKGDTIKLTLAYSGTGDLSIPLDQRNQFTIVEI